MTVPNVPCPACGRDAPIVYRGVVPHCTACGAYRAPLSTPSVNLAGKSSQMGGTVASVAGWLILLGGLAAATGVGLLTWALFTLTAALWVAGPIALVSAAMGWLLLRSGKSLRQSGRDAERATREQALVALAQHHGRLTAADAARVLRVPIPVADGMLTDLAKRDPERIAVDVDDQGVVWYRAIAAMPHVRVDAFETPGPGGARVDAGGSDLAEIEAEAEAERRAK